MLSTGRKDKNITQKKTFHEDDFGSAWNTPFLPIQ